MSEVVTSKVDVIVKALAELENDIDSLNSKVADMKKSLQTTTQKEKDKLMEQVREMATKEAEAMINQARQKAKAQAEQILKTGEEKVEKTKNQIDAKFDEAVDYVVSTVLKA